MTDTVAPVKTIYGNRIYFFRVRERKSLIFLFCLYMEGANFDRHH